jgi:hypothetical protein
VYLALRLQLEAQLGSPPPREAVTILLGQMALETGRFKSAMNYNLGGIKCPKSWPGCWQHFTTTERLPAAVAAKYLEERVPDATVELVTRDGDSWTLRFRGKHPVNRFVAFESLEAAVEHHVAFLLGRYRSAVELAITTKSAEAYVQRCYELRYFTADPNTYARNVASLSREYGRTLPPDPTPAPPTRPVEALVSLAATVPAPEPQTARIEAPTAPSEPTSPAPPPVAPVVLPRIGQPAEEPPRPWWLRLLVWFGKLLVRRPLP